MNTQWPTEDDIASLGREAGLEAATAMGGYVAATVARFERETGWLPWLPTGTESQFLDPPQYWQQDAIYLAFPVTPGALVYVSWNESSSTGTLLTENLDYEWVAHQFPGGLEGIYGIRFFRDPGSKKRSIKISGTRGTTCEIPDDLYQAVLDGAFAEAIPVFRGSADGPIAEEETSIVSVKFGIEAGRSKEDVLKARLDKAIKAYTPMRL